MCIVYGVELILYRNTQISETLKGYAEAISSLAHFNTLSSSSSSLAEGSRRRTIRVGQSTRRGHEHFCSLKAQGDVTRNQCKTVPVCVIVG